MLATLATFTALAFAQQTDTQIAVRQGIRLEVNNYGGGIVVKAWNQNAVRVHAEHSSRDYVDVNLEPSVLTVKAASRRGPPGVVDYTINAPAWMALINTASNRWTYALDHSHVFKRVATSEADARLNNTGVPVRVSV